MDGRGIRIRTDLRNGEVVPAVCHLGFGQGIAQATPETLGLGCEEKALSSQVKKLSRAAEKKRAETDSAREREVNKLRKDMAAAVRAEHMMQGALDEMQSVLVKWQKKCGGA